MEQTCNQPVVTFLKGRYTILLVSLLFFLTLYPIINALFPYTFFLDAFLVLIWVGIVRMVIHRRTYFYYALAVLGLALVVTAVDILHPQIHLKLYSSILYIAFLEAPLFAILKDVFTAEKISGDHIAGALCAYMLLGIIWGFIFVLIELIWPGSFKHGGELLELSRSARGSENESLLFYYSYVTLTTLGYGDISPTGPPATSLAIAEAIIGQFYLVVLVARLVGLHIAQRK